MEKKIREFNEGGEDVFTLSLSMGQAELGKDGDVEAFLSRMDEEMYKSKRRYHLLQEQKVIEEEASAAKDSKKEKKDKK